MKRIFLTLKGMSCDHCIGTIKAAVEQVPGVMASRVGLNAAEVEIDEARCRPAEVVSAVRSSGAFDVLNFRVESGS